MILFNNKYRSFEDIQPHLIQRLLHCVIVENGANKGKTTPDILPLLHNDINDKPRRYEWKYWAINRMLVFLIGPIRPDINMIVHQTSRFNNN